MIGLKNKLCIILTVHEYRKTTDSNCQLSEDEETRLSENLDGQVELRDS